MKSLKFSICFVFVIMALSLSISTAFAASSSDTVTVTVIADIVCENGAISPDCTTCPANTSMVDGSCVCTNGANDPSACTICPVNTSMINGLCTCTNGANNPAVCNICPSGTSMINGSCTCTNSATNPSLCTTINGECLNGATNPDLCTENIKAPVVTVRAESDHIKAGHFSTISWDSQYATSCALNDGTDLGGKSGHFQTDLLYADTTYIVYCNGAGGTRSDSDTVIVDLSEILPTVSIILNPRNVPFNGISSISWTSTNSTSCSLSGGGLSSSGVSGNEIPTKPLTVSTEYSVTCTGLGGTAVGKETVTVGKVKPSYTEN